VVVGGKAASDCAAVWRLDLLPAIVPVVRSAVVKAWARKIAEMAVMRDENLPAHLHASDAADTTSMTSAAKAAAARECFVVRGHQSSDDKRGNERRRDFGSHNAFSVSLDGAIAINLCATTPIV
jgi:hypothetical protein